MLTYLLCKTTSISTGVYIRQQDRQLRGYSHCGSTAAPRFKGLRDHHSGRSGNAGQHRDAFEAFQCCINNPHVSTLRLFQYSHGFRSRIWLLCCVGQDATPDLDQRSSVYMQCANSEVRKYSCRCHGLSSRRYGRRRSAPSTRVGCCRIASSTTTSTGFIPALLCRRIRQGVCPLVFFRRPLPLLLSPRLRLSFRPRFSLILLRKALFLHRLLRRFLPLQRPVPALLSTTLCLALFPGFRLLDRSPGLETSSSLS